MTSERFDVLIVGAGPAGSFAAEKLARGGVRVALFDGRPAGEPKACGGGVTSKALKAWPHLLEAVGRTITKLEMYSPAGKRLHLKLEEPFAIYSRTAFRFLPARARAEKPERTSSPSASRFAGVRVKKTIGCCARETGDEWSAPMLVAADGANSRIAKELAGPLPPSEMEVAFGYRAPLPEGTMRRPSSLFFRAGLATRGPSRASITSLSASPHRRTLSIIRRSTNCSGISWSATTASAPTQGASLARSRRQDEESDALIREGA